MSKKIVQLKLDKNFSNISEIIKYMNPFIIYLRIFGVFPYKIEGYELKYSWWGVIQTMNLFILVLWGFSFLFLGDPFNEVLSKFEQTQFVSCAMIGLTIFLLQYKRFKRYVEIILIIANEILIPKETIKRLLKLELTQVCFSAVFIAYFHFVPLTVGAIILENWMDLTNILYVFFFFFTNTFYLVECIFVNFVLAIAECFRYINKEISSMEINISEKETNVKHLNNIVDTERLIAKLSRLFKLHSDLSDIVIDLNSMFSVQLLISTWISFFEILFSSYYGILFIVDRESYDPEETIFGMYLIVWGFFHVIRFQMLCSACDAVKKEVFYY